MGYRIEAGEPVADAVRRIAGEEIAAARKDLRDADVHEAVHEVRKRCKKLRGLLRLVRPALGETYAAENAAFRDAARTLSRLRDATSHLECLDALLERYGDEVDAGRYAPVRAELVAQREARAREQDLDARLERFDRAMAAAEGRATGWTLEAEGFAALRGGLKKTYRRARRNLREASGVAHGEAWHEWRKRTKYNRYHVQLLRGMWPQVLEPLYDEVKRLSDYLGDEHDLQVLRRTLLADPNRFGEPRELQSLLALAEARRAELQAWARPLGERLYAEKPGRWVDRLGGLWRAWQEEQVIDRALPEGSDAVS